VAPEKENRPMKALTYHGKKDVRIEEVPDPVLAQPDDIILRVTATAICGSDLHLYRGKIPALHDGDIWIAQPAFQRDH
jgi:threonine dehydrogenase-like Zn-dependent dehydrogenase